MISTWVLQRTPTDRFTPIKRSPLVADQDLSILDKECFGCRQHTAADQEITGAGQCQTPPLRPEVSPPPRSNKLPVLPILVSTTDRRRREAAGLLQAAGDTEPGELIPGTGGALRRRTPRRDPRPDARRPHPGRRPVAEGIRRGLGCLRRRRQSPDEFDVTLVEGQSRTVSSGHCSRHRAAFVS